MAAITVTYGSCIDMELVFTDDEGQPEDVTNDSFSVLSASSAALTAAEFTKVEPLAGRVHFFLPSEEASKLSVGSHWLRVRRILDTGCEDNTSPIDLVVQ